LSQNLYNYANYVLRHSLFKGEGLPKEYDLTGLLAGENQSDYKALPAQTAQQVINLLYKNWKAYFKALKSYQRDKSKILGCPKIPKYKPRGEKGYYIASFTNQQVKIKDGRSYFLNLQI
jgi:transposase, orfB, ISHp609